MKKSDPRMLRHPFILLLLLVIQQSAHAQVVEPSGWQTFVGSADNASVVDTFRMQSFEGTKADNWTYEASNGCTKFDASSVDIKGQGGASSLKLPLGGSIKFARYSLDKYSNVNIKLHYGGKNLVKGENLSIKAYRDNTNGKIDICTVSKTPSNYDLSGSGITVGGDPPALDVIASSAASGTKRGYYCLDSLYAYGSIPRYSLFSGNGSGSWNDTTRWSHLPAARHRNALINADVVVDADAQCNELHIGKGSLSVSPNAGFTANAVIVHRSFEQKGRWYFISFPFDVYPDSVDNSFVHKDATPNSGGNYFYVQSYNGSRRATAASNTGNWEVLSPSSISAGQPLFKKNKGYLIALDASATGQTIRFSARKADIAEGFGKSNTSIPVVATTSANSEHSGWYLCGNPLPAALSLSQIESNSATDGNIYVYNGSTYTAYAVGSQNALPPFAAFFVKASAVTQLIIRPATTPAAPLLSAAALPLRQSGGEPSAGVQTGHGVSSLRLPQSYLEGNHLCLADLPVEGELHVFTINGQLIRRHALPAGTSVVSLPLQRGLYVLRVSAGSYQAHHKFIP